MFFNGLVVFGALGGDASILRFYASYFVQINLYELFYTSSSARAVLIDFYYLSTRLVKMKTFHFAVSFVSFISYILNVLLLRSVLSLLSLVS